jgi:hypothetical protein
MKVNKVIWLLLVLLIFAAIIYFVRGFYYGTKTIYELLVENRQLKSAITNLTVEDQIGYAKVISQEVRDSNLYTTIRFVETDRNDKNTKILEKDYTIEGDIVHFDALIVRFSNRMVMDGKEKALYLWRRVYGEKMPPGNGYPIEEAGKEPIRYNDLLKFLPEKQKDLFWSNIWDLANDTEKLKEYGIIAVYGNAVYNKLTKGKIYIFKISSTGQLYPEIIPEM